MRTTFRKERLGRGVGRRAAMARRETIVLQKRSERLGEYEDRELTTLLRAVEEAAYKLAYRSRRLRLKLPDDNGGEAAA